MKNLPTSLVSPVWIIQMIYYPTTVYSVISFCNLWVYAVLSSFYIRWATLQTISCYNEAVSFEYLSKCDFILTVTVAKFFFGIATRYLVDLATSRV